MSVLTTGCYSTRSAAVEFDEVGRLRRLRGYWWRERGGDGGGLEPCLQRPSSVYYPEWVLMGVDGCRDECALLEVQALRTRAL